MQGFGYRAAKVEGCPSPCDCPAIFVLLAPSVKDAREHCRNILAQVQDAAATGEADASHVIVVHPEGKSRGFATCAEFAEWAG